MNKKYYKRLNFFQRHKFEIVVCLFCVALAMLYQSQKLLKIAKESNYSEIVWDKEMIEVMCDTNAESISFDENFAWLYVWLGSMDAKYDVYDQVVMSDEDTTLTIYCSNLKAMEFEGKLKEKLDEIVKDYEKTFKRKVDISQSYKVISLSTEPDYEYRLDDDYELRLIRLYVLALQSLRGGKDWTLTINVRDKNTMEILKRIELPGNIERETETEG